MPVFFNGSLIVSPKVASMTDDSALINTNGNVGNVAFFIGTSAGGQPNTALHFGSPDQAAATLISGDLLDACNAAFNASADTASPQEIICIRVNPATQSTLVLKDASSNPVINLASSDYGQYTQQDSVRLDVGSTSGLKITAYLGQSYYVQDNVARSPFSIRYTGAGASATMTIAAASITLAVAGATVATINLTTFPTVYQAVAAINAVPGFTAAVLGGFGNTPTLNGLDFVTTQDVKTALFTATANLQAVVDWFNSPAEPLLTATRVAGAGTVPVPIPQTYLTGGSDGIVTNTQWSNAFTAAQALTTVYWGVALSVDPAIHVMADAHAVYMSNVVGRRRRMISGMALGSTDAQAIAEAYSLNSPRSALVHLGVYLYNATGALTLYEPYITAAMVAGAFSGLNPGTPLTNKLLNIQGIERTLLNPTDTDQLITGGVLCVAPTATGYRVVQSISTWLGDSAFDKVELSTGWAVDYALQTIEGALDIYKGKKANALTLAQEVQTVKTTLTLLAKPEPQGVGVLAGDAASPAFKGITGTLNGDVTAISLQMSPVIPNNYILVNVALTPYSATVTIS